MISSAASCAFGTLASIAIGASLGGCAGNNETGAFAGGDQDAGDGGTAVPSDDGGTRDEGATGLSDAMMGGPGMDRASAGGQDAIAGADASGSPGGSDGAGKDASGVRDAGTGQDGTAGRYDAGPGNEGGAPAVRFVGRTAPGTVGTRFEWPGVSIAARFSGTQVSIQLNDGNNGNEFEVVVDGKILANAVTAAGQTTYALATGLSSGMHDLLVWRRTEAYYNPTEFLGLTNFGPGGSLLAPPAAPSRRIEIIGDSISCGYGIEGLPGCTASTSNENNYLAYGSVAARALGADAVTIAWSGIGMYRNYNDVGPSTSPMPARYDFAIPTDTTTTWDFAKYQPHAVIINLGSNDFSTHGDPGQPYVDAYVNFVKHVRSKYAKAYIFSLIQVPLSATDINQAVTALKTGGEAMIESFDINVPDGGYGCDGHPDVVKSNAMGVKLATEMQRVLGW